MTVPIERDAGHVYHLFPIRSPQRDALRAHLRAAGVETLIHYPLALSEQRAFADCVPAPCPVATAAASELLSLPLDPRLSDEDAKAKGADFYAAEMKERLAKGPVSFELVAVRGRDGDQTSDPTTRWEDEDGRATTPLGKISIEALAPNATCDAFSFLPGNVTDGISGPPDDPVFQIRSADYLVSFTRRVAQ